MVADCFEAVRVLEQQAVMIREFALAYYPGILPCLEVLDHHPNGIPVRDTKNPEGPALVVAGPVWASFVAGVKGGALRTA